MIKKIKNNLWQLNFQEFGSCVYILIIENKKIIIDTGSPMNKQELIQDLKELKINSEDIDIMILTHNHFDHIGNIDLFTNAKIYGSKEDFKQENIIDIDKLPIKEFKIIKTPGHTPGGISILYKDILFSGDTIFEHGYVGRTDFPGGDYKELQKSIEKLKKVKYKTLCPGHLV
jgi:glyoxylase-like metal-dependent hydrolase (beta-lactamase superfamily II)